jgi:predicted RecB family nuclease
MMDSASPLTLAVLEGYLRCKYLGALRLAGEHGDSLEYVTAWQERQRLVRSTLTNRADHAGTRVAHGMLLSRDALRRGDELILDARLIGDAIAMDYPGLQRVRGDSALGHFHYTPILLTGNQHPSPIDRSLAEVPAVLLEDVQAVLPAYGIVYCGPACKAVKVKFSAGLKKAKDLLRTLRPLQTHEAQPRLILNDHCPVCEFSARCHEQAVREDNISLIRGLGQKALAAYARRGILTLTQLAHTFRPRRRGKRTSGQNPKRFHALQALAIRDRRVYVLGAPTVPSGEVVIYLDLEGVPDEGFVYLIGMIVCNGTSQRSYSFWADKKSQERGIFEQFLDVVASYEAPTIFTYGGYERAFIKRMRQGTRRKKLVDRILDRLVNLLGIIYAHFYFPTYGNGLKDIGRLLGCAWTDERASGAMSLLWRHRWKASGEDHWRRMLITYNQDDCAALLAVAEYLRRSGAPQAPGPPIVQVQELDRLAYSPKWGPTKFGNEDFEAINSRAHFDYQQQRVFVRTNKRLKRRLRKPRIHRNGLLRVTKQIEVTARRCPACKGVHVHPLSDRERAGMHVRSKRSIDLTFTAGGIRRRVLACKPAVYRCGDCGHRFAPEKYGRIATHGHALMSWAMHGHVAHRLSCGTLESLVWDYFGLAVSDVEIRAFKELLAKYYQKTYHNLLTKLCSASVLHIDETEVLLRTGKGYVWVFASMEDVAYVYRPSREGDFLKEMLGCFKGVLVSDFYAAYDGVDCPQQKCLIHLIRDLNQMLLAHPFDGEVQSETERFGTLLRQTVATIDEHGLRRHYLRRHRADINRYFEALAGSSPQSEAAQAIRERLLRYRTKLFTFVDHDDVAWNNNPAENAIKQFAYYREGRTGIMREPGLRDYLTLLSLYQTCRYRGVEFLPFLLSGERDIEAFASSKSRARRRPAFPVYPKGVTSPFLASLNKVRGKAQVQAKEPKNSQSQLPGERRQS